MPTTSTLLTAGRLAVSFLIEDLRVIFAPSCRTVARLRFAANDDLTVIVPARSSAVDTARATNTRH